ncbi:MAG: shikimate kinase [Clostridia bacterium]|nr:shikimate kinase [Clostridia bacterium]
MNRYETLKCGLIGKTLGHSYSPQIHAEFADYEYKLYEMPEEEVGTFLKTADYTALNVTIPYKKTVMPFLDEISPEALRIGSVNTITRTKDGGLRGDNTDYYGFSYMLDCAGIDVAGKKVLVIGNGGSSMTARTVAEDRKAREVVIIGRADNRPEVLATHADCEVLFNTTPVGMYPNAGVSPVSLDFFPKLEGIVDVIYNPAVTRLAHDAKERGLKWITGLTMLVAQAKMASELFTGGTIDDAEIERVTEKVGNGMKNILLVGMPGCGKSTIGSKLAELTGRTFVDTDALIVERAGVSIPEIFAAHGEAYFRKLETEVLAEVSQKSALILATGGGVVTRPENHPLCNQNSIVAFLNRDISILPKDGRPISQSRDLGELYRERLPLYRAVCDFEIEVDTPDVTANARKILDKVGL